MQVYCPAVMRIQGANPITHLQFDNLRCKSYCPFLDAQKACRCESIAPFDFDPSTLQVPLPWVFLSPFNPYGVLDAFSKRHAGANLIVKFMEVMEIGLKWVQVARYGYILHQMKAI